MYFYEFALKSNLRVKSVGSTVKHPQAKKENNKPEMVLKIQPEVTIQN